MHADGHSPNTIRVAGAERLLVVTVCGTAVHLASGAEAAGRAAVPDGPPALADPRWSATTMCGRRWAAMIGGDGGPVGPSGRVAFAPSCRRCLALIDRHFPKPVPDSRLALIAQLAADAVVDRRGFAEVHDVPGDQQGELRRAIRALIRRRMGQPVRTYSINGIIHVECDAAYARYTDRNGRLATELLRQGRPAAARDWVISWSAWEVG